MASYLGEPAYEHGSDAATGVLLVNLGTPDAPTPAAIRRFLAEFLWDPRVVEGTALAVVAGAARRHPAHPARAQRPRVSTDLDAGRLAAAAAHPRSRRTAFAPRCSGTRLRRSRSGMTYGSPSITDALEQLRRAGVRRLIVLPLYPQYSGTTTASVFDRVTRELQRWRWVPELRFIGNYHDEPAYIDAIAASIREHWRTHERGHLLFSFHGIPRRYLLAGDPYHCQCLKTARLVAERLGLDAERVERELSVAGGTRRMAAAVHRRDAAEHGARRPAARHRRVPRIRDGLPGDAGRNRDPQSRAVHGERR